VINAVACGTVNVEHFGDGMGRRSGDPFDCALNQGNYIEKTDPAGKEGCHCDFVCGIQDDCLAAVRFERLASDLKRWKARLISGFEV